MTNRRPVKGIARPMTPRTLLGQDPELLRRVSEKADSAATTRAVLAWLSPVASRVEPALEDSVSELARVTLTATPSAELGAGRAGVVVLPWIPPASLLARMGVRTLCPVVRPCTSAPPDLELVHAEIVA